MPTKSKAQRRLMAAAAHTSGGFGGVPQSVGKKFLRADRDLAASHRRAHHAKVAALGKKR